MDVKADNSEDAVFAVAEKLGIVLSKENIQRCHRIGKRRAKPRPIIVKLKCWSKRMEFIKAKATLRDVDWSTTLVKNDKEEVIPDAAPHVAPPEDTENNVNVGDVTKRNGKNINIFITEDLSPFRLKILHYVKDFNNNEGQKIFDIITTRNGNITCRVKSTAQWHTISSPEDFLASGIPMNADKFTELMY